MTVDAPRLSLDAYLARFKVNATRRKDVTDSVARAGEASGLKKVLTATDLVLLGIGGIIGAGVFVLTGVAAREEAGPAVIFSYLISAFASFLAALCYTEFAVELPVAGSAYNYIAVTFGELPAFLCGCDLVLEYSISAAAVSRGWTSYAATFLGKPSDAFRIPAGSLALDPLAALLVAAECGVLCLGIKESSKFNAVVNVIMFVCIAFVLLAGAAEVERKNYTPFAPFGLAGVFSGASIVFFSFIGFDTVATAAEEVRNPGRDLPLGIMGSLAICTALYAAMCAVITGMVPYGEIDLEAPFAAAFRDRGMLWASRVVSAGALTGITTSLLVSLLGQPRVYMTMARDGLLPPWLAVVHPTYGTPVHATLVTGLTAGTMALLVDIDALAQLVSIGTLCVFCFVCAACLGRRYLPTDAGGACGPAPGALAAARAPVLRRIAGLAASALGWGFAVELGPGGPAGAMLALPFLAAFGLVTRSLAALPVVCRPKRFAVPWQPYIPAAGVFVCVQLISSLGPLCWLRFVVFYTFSVLVYAYYRGGVDPALAAQRAADVARGGGGGGGGGGGPGPGGPGPGAGGSAASSAVEMATLSSDDSDGLLLLTLQRDASGGLARRSGSPPAVLPGGGPGRLQQQPPPQDPRVEERERLLATAA